MKMRRTWPSNFPSKANGNLSGKGRAMALAKAGQGYVSLPPVVFANATDITIATWVKITTSQSWQHLLDVGINANLANNTSTGTIYMNLVPKNGGTNLAFAISKDGYASAATPACGSGYLAGDRHGPVSQSVDRRARGQARSRAA